MFRGPSKKKETLIQSNKTKSFQEKMISFHNNKSSLFIFSYHVLKIVFYPQDLMNYQNNSFKLIDIKSGMAGHVNSKAIIYDGD